MANNVTRMLAKELYDKWRDEMLTIAPPGQSHIGSFHEQRSYFMREAVKLKKTVAYRRVGMYFPSISMRVEQ